MIVFVSFIFIFASFLSYLLDKRIAAKRESYRYVDNCENNSCCNTKMPLIEVIRIASLTIYTP